MCPSGIADGHTQDGYAVIRSPIHFGMSGTLLDVNCPGILFVFGLLNSKAHTFQAGPLEFEGLSGKTVGLLWRMINIYFFH